MTSASRATAPPDLEMAEIQPLGPTPSSQGDGSKDNDPSCKEEFIYADNFEPFPLGWPKLAAQQNKYSNGSIHRRFGYLFQRAIFHNGGRLAWLEKLLIESDKEASEKQRTSLSPEQKRDVVGGEDRQEERQEANDEQREGDSANRSDALMEEMTTLLMRRAKLMLYDKELRNLPKVSRPEHRNLWDHIHGEEILDEDGRIILLYPDDCVTTSRRDRVHVIFELLLYGKLRSWLAGRPWKISKNKERDEDNESRKGSWAATISTAPLKNILDAAIITFCGLVFLLPVLILFLIPLTKVQSAAAVISFVVFFAMCMTIISDKLETIFVALCAFLAVLVTFLANFQSSTVDAGHTAAVATAAAVAC